MYWKLYIMGCAPPTTNVGAPFIAHALGAMGGRRGYSTTRRTADSLGDNRKSEGMKMPVARNVSATGVFIFVCAVPASFRPTHRAKGMRDEWGIHVTGYTRKAHRDYAARSTGLALP